jgi:dinuclear metal center YbgI/SA1388 family protein
MAPQPVILQDILTILDTTAPFSLAESWDNVGLMLGDPKQEISGILIGLDPTSDLLKEAVANNANLIINHHPLIFTPLKKIRTDQPTGHFISEAIKNNIAVIGCHTNLDVVSNGVSHVLAERIGLGNSTPLTNTNNDDPSIGFGKVGSLPGALDSDIFFSQLCQILDLPVLKICGSIPKKIIRVAVCGGSGSELAEAALAAKAEVYITGEVKHSVARWAEESGLCIIDAGHFATENMITETLSKTLTETMIKQDMDLSVQASTLQSNPFFYYIKPQ